jgi:hypothetical protein
MIATSKGRRTITMQRTALKLCAILMLALAALSVGVAAQKKDTSAKKAAAAKLPERIWRDPGDMASLDLIYGAGGKAHAPDPAGTFTFVKEDLLATSPKFDVTDGHGVAWKVKIGQEPQSETAATRFLWAAGYFVDEDYYMAELTVKGLPKLQRGQDFVSGGIVHGARLERKLTTVKKLENWDWFDNPFVGQRELNGLRVMMSLLNNWDLKKINNSIYAVDGERHYLISDAGATFGNTGNVMTRSKSVPKDYEDSKFIAKVTPDFIDFVLHSRPFFLGIVEPSNYGERTKMEEITKHIPRADAKWLGQRLSRLTDDQIRDGFRAAGYGTGDLETLTRTIRLRIAALEAL